MDLGKRKFQKGKTNVAGNQSVGLIIIFNILYDVLAIKVYSICKIMNALFAKTDKSMNMVQIVITIEYMPFLCKNKK